MAKAARNTIKYSDPEYDKSVSTLVALHNIHPNEAIVVHFKRDTYLIKVMPLFMLSLLHLARSINVLKSFTILTIGLLKHSGAFILSI